tara:strand:- start:190 stop:513 length:324 start_codon:yes stop_codon:yes gene_type:complete
MSKLKVLKPANRHLLVIPHVEKNETSSGVLLPEDFAPDVNRYIEATVIDIAEDCSKQFKNLKYTNFDTNKTVIIDQTMIEEVTISDKTYHLILENYIVGMYRRPDED